MITASHGRLLRWFWIAWGAVFLFRLGVLWWLPLDLAGDEAYYWEWGRHLDWGYYSKPPGIGWIMALAGWVAGDSAAGIRVFALCFGSGSIIFIFLLARRLYGDLAAVAAGVISMANPGNSALCLLLTIDAPLMFCWTAALYLFWVFLEGGMASWRTGVLLGLALAGGVLTKQMMLVFYPLALAFLWLDRDRRRLLASWRLWTVLSLSLTALVPPILWNAHHDWITVRHTLHHFDSASSGVRLALTRFVEFFGSQLGLTSPIVFLLVLWVMGLGLRSWSRLSSRERYVFLFSGPALAVVFAMAFRQRINANWPAVFYPAAFVLLSGWATRGWSGATAGHRLRPWFKPGVQWAIGWTLAAYLLLAGVSLGWIHAGALDPTARIRGWKRLAGRVAAAYDSFKQPENVFLLTVGHRYLASELAFYLPGHPRVFRFDSRIGEVTSQYDFWETPAAKIGSDALIVFQGRQDAIPDRLTRCFRQVRFLRELRDRGQTKRKRLISLFYGKELFQWP